MAAISSGGGARSVLWREGRLEVTLEASTCDEGKEGIDDATGANGEAIPIAVGREII